MSPKQVTVSRPNRSTASDAPVPRWHVAALGAVSALLVAAAWFLPLWRATLFAPQYPGGLTMHAYGNQVTGDVDEISALNHYVGMRPFDLADFPEMALWPYAIVGAFVAVGLALLLRRPLLRAAGLVYLWGMPLGALAVIQFRLHQYGHDLDPGAALRLDPFTPWVVGPTEVWNFNTWSWPGAGTLVLLFVAALLTFGPRLLRRVTLQVSAVSAVGALVLAGGLVALPAGPASAAPSTSAPQASAAQAPGDLNALFARAEPGQRVVVPAGTYRGPVVIDIPITVEPRGRVEVIGDGTGTVLTVRAPGTVIDGLHLRGSGPGPTGNPAAIRVEADDVTIEGVTIEDSYMGIAVEEAARVRLVDNHIIGRAGATIVGEEHAVDHERPDAARDSEAGEGGHDHAGHDGGGGHGPEDDHAPAATGHRARGDGIWLHDVDHVLVRGNRIDHARDGIYVSFGSNALIDGNSVHDSRYAVHSMYASDLTLVENHFHHNLSGAVLMYRGPALVLRNHIEGSSSPSTGFALLIKDVVGVEATQNVFVDNRVGIHIDGPVGGEEAAVMTANTVADNAIGVAAYPSSQAVFKANSFVNNHIQVLPRGGRLSGLRWSDQGLGNLWSSYRGYEGFAAGRGAVPHTEGGAIDRLLGRNPELLVLAETPAVRVLRSVEERWGRQTPVLVDEFPLTSPVSPPVPGGTVPSGEGRVSATVVGGALLAPFLLLAFRGRRNPRQPSRSTFDVIH